MVRSKGTSLISVFLVLLWVCLGIIIGHWPAWKSTRVAVADAEGSPKSCASVTGDGDLSGSVNITDAITILTYLFVSSPGRLPPVYVETRIQNLPDTGQTTSYGPCLGQDSSYVTACPSGDRFQVVEGNNVVVDTCTGLMWQQVTADINSD